MCGTGPLDGEMRELVAGGPEGVTILGVRNDIPELLGTADLFVSTSRNEGMPLNVMEAMAAHWAGQRVCGVSLVTNAGAGLSPTPLTHAEVVEAADEAGPRLARVIGRFAQNLAAG